MSVISERLQKTRSTEEELAVLATAVGGSIAGQDTLAVAAGFDTKTHAQLTAILAKARQITGVVEERKDMSSLSQEVELFREENRILKKRLAAVESRVLEALRVEGVR
jgi:hypothetical protein